MRLFDQITQHATPLLVAIETPGTQARLVRLPGALEFAPQINSCPLLFDKDPPVVTQDIVPSGSPNAYPTYDTLGRQLFVAFTATF